MSVQQAVSPDGAQWPFQTIDVRTIESLKMLQLETTEFLSELIQLFLDTTKERLKNIEKSIHTKEFVVIQMESHSLKSSCGNLGAYRMLEICKDLEQVAKAGSLEACQLLAERVQAEFARTQKDLLQIQTLELEKAKTNKRSL